MKPKQLEKTGLITIRITTTFMIVIFSGCAHVDYQPIELWNTMPVSATKYFPYSLDSSWVYEDQDGNEFIRRVVEEEINGKIYHAFSYEPELEDKMAYSPFLYPALYHVSDTGSITLLCGDEVEKSIKARLTKEMEVLTRDYQSYFENVEIDIEVQGQDHLLFLPCKLAVDTPWEVNNIKADIKIGDESIDFATITETGRILGTETIQTPVGTFEDCLKVEYKTQTETSITPSEIEPPGETITTVWFAPDIGMVKYHQKSDPIFWSMIPAGELELDIAKFYRERTLQLKEADIK